MWGYYHAAAQSPGQHMCGGGGRGGVTTHAAVKLRNAGQLGQAWRYCVVKTFPSPSISFPSAWQHAPRPAPPPMCSGAYRAWPGCVTRVRPRGVGWEVGAGVARVISDILRRRMLGMYRSMTRSHGGLLAWCWSRGRAVITQAR